MQAEKISIYQSILSVKGKIFWNDGRRRIDLKKPIRDIIVANKTASYVMELCLSKESLSKRIKELLKEKTLPVIMYFVRDENGSN